MNTAEAKAAARRWVAEEASHLPGFGGAMFHGSTTMLADEAPFAAASDVDLMLLLAGPPPLPKPGKFRYHGVILDVFALTAEDLRTPDQLLGWYHLAPTFRFGEIIADPTGRLAALQVAVTAGFAKRGAVLRRCQDARNRALGHLRSLDAAAPFHDHVTSWLFGTGVTTHVLLVAGLRNPTVRRRYLATRRLLADYGHLDCYESLLGSLGCAATTRARAEHHLAAVAAAFDAANGVISTPFPFASDISDVARPLAIDGSRWLIEQGDHREAVFWLAVTAARCQTVLHHDAPPELRRRFAPGFRDLLADLGIGSPADLRRRAAEVKAALPEVRSVAEAIIVANPEIEP